MSLLRIKSIILHSWYYQKRSLEAWVDIFWWSFMSIIVFGFMALYFAQNNSDVAGTILTGNILWEVARIAQVTLSVSVLRLVWSRNLSNLFTTPLQISEFFIAQMFVGLINSSAVFIFVSFIALKVYHFSIFQLGFDLVFHIINLLIFSWACGIAIVGLVFRYGNRIQAFAWSMFILLQPISAVFYPLSVLPDLIQKIAFAIPMTYTFEASREKLFLGTTNYNYIMIAFLENVVYFILAYLFFICMFASSKKTGQFAKMEH